MIGQRVLLKSIPEKIPSENHFQIENFDITTLKEDEVLIQNQFLSLDPYMRSQIAGRHLSGTIKPGEMMRGETVGKIIDSKSTQFNTGDMVIGFGGWCSHYIASNDSLNKIDSRIIKPQYALSVQGMPGLTGWAAVKKLAEPKKGDIFLTAAASGPVGSTAAQIAKMHGCTTIGVVGSEQKKEWALSFAKYDHVINRKKEDTFLKIKEIVNGGVDIYLDLIAGQFLLDACDHIAMNARVILCGAMSEYNVKKRMGGPSPAQIIKARAKVMGLVVYDYYSVQDEFINDTQSWIDNDHLAIKEDIYNGLEKAPYAFERLMSGKNFGKTLIEI